jgi:hypothetical protein
MEKSFSIIGKPTKNSAVWVRKVYFTDALDTRCFGEVAMVDFKVRDTGSRKIAENRQPER